MGILKSKLFTEPPSDRLEACALRDPDHITPGSHGDPVRRIQIALNRIADGKLFLAMDGKYGPRTAAAVVAFKEAQVPPLRQPGQTVADNIVGIRTVRALDQQIFDLDNAPPRPPTGLISLTPFGTPHDHNKCTPFLDSDDFQGRISHHGTPINPLGIGRKIAIGGTNEVKYLGFENFVPDPAQDPDMLQSLVQGRPFTHTIRSHTVSDVCFRSAPIDRFMQGELKRIAMQGCRLTYASNEGMVAGLMPYLLSLGPQLETALVAKNPDAGIVEILNGLHVVVINMHNLS